MCRSYLCLFVLVVYSSCSTNEQKHHDIEVIIDNTKIDEQPIPIQQDSVLLSDISDSIYINRYDCEISGDFDGDGKLDSLKEAFTLDDSTYKNQYFEDYDELVEYVIRNNPKSFLASANLTDTLFIETRGQSLGIVQLRNEGDLNDDGGDEISYVTDWADWSTVSICHLMSYTQEGWKELYAIPIWEWQYQCSSEKEDEEFKGFIEDRDSSKIFYPF